MFNRIDQELDLSSKALSLRSYRQELLASNIANADTPNYKARDFDFKAALANSMGGAGGGGVQMSKTSAGHLDASDGSSGMPGVTVQYRGEYQSSVDGNTVNMDIERSNFIENSLQMEALLTFVHSHVQVMNLALQS